MRLRHTRVGFAAILRRLSFIYFAPRSLFLYHPYPQLYDLDSCYFCSYRPISALPCFLGTRISAFSYDRAEFLGSIMKIVQVPVSSPDPTFSIFLGRTSIHFVVLVLRSLRLYSSHSGDNLCIFVFSCSVSLRIRV